jgi:mRNA interferase RelE/StbE
MFDLVLTHEALRFYERADVTLVRRLNRCFDQLRENPHEHPNIKRLSAPLTGCFRYRVGDWRVVYSVNEAACTITVLLIVHRSRAYR